MIRLIALPEGTISKWWLFDSETGRVARIVHIEEGAPESWAKMVGSEAKPLGGGRYAVLDAVVRTEFGHDVAFALGKTRTGPYSSAARWQTVSELVAQRAALLFAAGSR